ncbi:MAG: hypothetical protein VYA08_11450, partial [Pseudomonadota bacterium]|nr:hypothetical protein [Pseudomonadota bacterium]
GLCCFTNTTKRLQPCHHGRNGTVPVIFPDDIDTATGASAPAATSSVKQPIKAHLPYPENAQGIYSPIPKSESTQQGVVDYYQGN